MTMQNFSLRTKLNIFVVLIVLFTKCDGTCRKENEAHHICASLEDIKQGDKKDSWVEVSINGNRKKETVKENSFVNIPNVRKLVLNGAVNKLNRKGFNGLNKITDLEFFNNDILELDSYVFANLPIEGMVLYTSNIKKLKPRCLDGLPKLNRIFVHKNSISNIPAGVFSYTNIEVLYLNDNKIRTIEEEAFYGMEKLRKLAVEWNELTTFDSQLLVGPASPNLVLLWLSRNYISKISKTMLTLFPKLKVLLLQINNIDTIEDGAFNGLNDLRYIDISNSKLTALSPDMFPEDGLPFLDILFLQNNRFMYISTDLIEKFPRLKKIAIGGNSWLCPCYQELRNYLLRKEITLLCDDEYLDGKRPVCISPSEDTVKCDPAKEDHQKLQELYYNAQKDYIKLPPLCKIYCTHNTSCYSENFDVLDYH